MRLGTSLAPVLAACIAAAAAHAQGTGTTGTSTTGGTSGPGATAPATGGTTPSSGSSGGATTPSASTSSPGTSGPGATGTATTSGKPASTGGTNSLFVGPTLSEVLGIGWTTSPGLGVLPGVRAGFWLPSGFLAGEAGLKLQASSGFSYSQLQLKVGGLYGHDLGLLGSLKAYGIGGLDVDLVASGSGTTGYLQPVFGLTLGAGLKYPVNPSWTLGLEAGLHTQAEFGTNVGLSTSLCVSVTGSWCAPGARPYSTDTTSLPPIQGPVVAVTDETQKTYSGTTTHHSSTTTPCSVYVTDGWMEPAQVAWQDDISFEDKPGKQLTRLDGDAVAYLAELPMTTKKATLLFGVHHYRRAGAPVIVDSRDFIVLSGMTNCTTPKPVKLRFTLNGVGGGETLWTSPEVGQVKLEGPAQKEYEPWSVRLPARNGISPDTVFKIGTAGGYQIRAELLDEGNPTGLLMTVGGQALDMMGPVVHFVPVMLTKLDAADEGSLVTLTESMADESARRIPDVFPLAPGGLPTSTRVVRNLVDAEVPSRWFEFRRISYLVAALNDTLAASTFLDGGGRVVAVMKSTDFKSVFGTGAAGMTVAESVEVKLRGQSARTLSWKVMLVPSYETWDTVAHEILHTLPEGWADAEMAAECGVKYHNTKDLLAHGEQITDDGLIIRDRKVAKISLMGPAVGTSQVFMDQCTYWHLTKMLAGGPPDPPVMMLRAMIGKKGGKTIGELRPVYELGGNADLRPGKGGPYAFVFKDAKGAELARFPFNPRATDIEMKTPVEVMSFVARAPLVPGWTQLEDFQDAKGAVLDKKVRSESPPEVTIEEPKDGSTVTPADGKVHVRWTARAATPLLSSVLYSTDGGAHWVDQAFEQTASELDVKLSPKVKDHLLKVVATDGTRSAEAVIRVKTK